MCVTLFHVRIYVHFSATNVTSRKWLKHESLYNIDCLGFLLDTMYMLV
jgi:hypothetical protein